VTADLAVRMVPIALLSPSLFLCSDVRRVVTLPAAVTLSLVMCCSQSPPSQGKGVGPFVLLVVRDRSQLDRHGPPVARRLRRAELKIDSRSDAPQQLRELGGRLPFLRQVSHGVHACADPS
jgi:hypothetical protein